MNWLEILIYIIGIIIAICLIYYVPKILISTFGMEIGEEGCFIATAAYGTPTTKEIRVLREFRDNTLNKSSVGKKLVNIYYKISPPFADIIAQDVVARSMVRKTIIVPLITVLKSLKE